MVAKKACNSLVKAPVSYRVDPTAAAQLEIGAMIQTGAAVASMIYIFKISNFYTSCV